MTRSLMLMQRRLGSTKDNGSNGLLADLSAMDWPSENMFRRRRSQEKQNEILTSLPRGLQSTKAKGPDEVMAKLWTAQGR